MVQRSVDPLPTVIKRNGRRSEESKRLRDIKRNAYAKANKAKPCSVSGCTHERYNLSCYCRGHFQKYRRTGRAVGEIPTQGELRAIEKAIQGWLVEDHLIDERSQRGFKLSWGTAQNRIRKNPAFALPFYRLEGNSGYTAQAKGWIILSHYFHRQGHSLSDAMIRYMAVRLWAEFKWQMPEGKRGFTRERNHFVNTWAGYFVLRNSGFSKTTSEERVIGWQRPWFVSENPRDNLPVPITERVSKTVYLTNFKAGPIVRAIGKELGAAVDHAMGTTWASDHRLLARTCEALGLPF